MIDWESDATEICFNSRFSQEQQKQFTQKIPPLKSHFILSTSGSSAQKWIALSKCAMLTSAKAVNHILGSTQNDIWVKCLPNHHVGGLSIYARAWLSRAKVVEYSARWNPVEYVAVIEKEKGTLSSLVPTQVYDLIQGNIKSPESLRAVVVGGGVLSPTLYEKAKQLHWPLLPSYGLTECSSQVATAEKDSQKLKLLPHIEAKTNAEGCLFLKSDALLTGILSTDQEQIGWIDPKKEGWFQTEDLAELSNGRVTILGRKDRMIKISGELVNVKNLESLLERICLDLHMPLEATLLPLPDARLEYSMCLVIAKEYAHYGELIRAEFLKHVLPFEQIRSVKIIDALPRTALGKIILPELIDSIDMLARQNRAS